MIGGLTRVTGVAFMLQKYQMSKTIAEHVLNFVHFLAIPYKAKTLKHHFFTSS